MSAHDLIERARLAITAVHQAFGAPGDYGYETAQGKALFELYQLGASARNFASKEIAGGADPSFRMHLAGQLGIADELLTQALLTLRETLEAKIEGDSYLTSDGDPVPAKIPENRDVIEQLFEEIALIREIEEHVCKPYTGPAWLDEIIEQGPAWAGEPA